MTTPSSPTISKEESPLDHSPTQTTSDDRFGEVSVGDIYEVKADGKWHCIVVDEIMSSRAGTLTFGDKFSVAIRRTGKTELVRNLSGTDRETIGEVQDVREDS